MREDWDPRFGTGAEVTGRLSWYSPKRLSSANAGPEDHRADTQSNQQHNREGNEGTHQPGQPSPERHGSQKRRSPAAAERQDQQWQREVMSKQRSVPIPRWLTGFAGDQEDARHGHQTGGEQNPGRGRGPWRLE